MLIDPSDPMDRAFYLGLYEPHLARLIADVVRPGDVCIDVGAHKGYITLHLARAVGPNGRVLAIDADPRAADHLRCNLQHNRIQHVSVFNCAVADASGTCELTLSKQLGWSSRFMNDLAKPTATATLAVQKQALDSIVEESGVDLARHRLSFIKIDVEGSEPLVLAGARRILTQFRPVLYMEVNTDSLRVAGANHRHIHSDLEATGYAVRLISARRTSSLRLTYVLAPVSSVYPNELPPVYEVVAFRKEPPCA